MYWNSDQGFRSLLPDLWQRRPLAQVLFDLMDRKEGLTRLPAFGGGRSLVVDLNRDGYPEIVFCNYIHNYPGVRTAYIYWGSRDGYSLRARTELPTRWAAGVASSSPLSPRYFPLPPTMAIAKLEVLKSIAPAPTSVPPFS